MNDNMRLFGLLGPAGVGKTEVASWFRYRGYVAIALADPLKRLVRSVFGFNVVSLWGPSYRRNDAVSTNIVHEGTSNKNRVANIFREFAKTIFPNNSPNALDFERVLCEWYQLAKINQIEISARKALQTLGTECGRNFSQDIWVNYLLNVIIPDLDVINVDYDPLIGLVPRSSYLPVNWEVRGVVVPDCRFKNEVNRIKARGGRLLKLTRPGKARTEEVGITGHASEEEQKSINDEEFHAVLRLPEGLPQLARYLSGAIVV